MYASIAAGSLLAALTLAVPLHGQQIAADVVLRSGPVAGHVVIGDGYSTYRRPVVYRRAPERVVIVERYAPRVVVVERVHGQGRWRHWREQGYRPVTLYYLDGRYYDRSVRGWPQMHEVVVFERDGRFYRVVEPRDREDNCDRVGHSDGRDDSQDDRHWDD
jgi:hypothetical protein